MSGSDSSEKNHDPTPKKLQDAREKGQVAQSKELTMLVSLLTLFLVMGFAAKSYLYNINNLMNLVISDINDNNLDYTRNIADLLQMAAIFCKIVLLPVVIASLVSGLANLVQIKGIVFSKEAFKFDLNRLNPVNNAKNIFSLKNLVKFVRQLIETTALAIAAILIIKNNLPAILLLYTLQLKQILAYLGILTFKLIATLLIIHFTFTIIDLIMEQRNLFKQLKMSRSEIEQEMKNTEGNMELKHERKQRHRELLNEGVVDAIMNSSFVLANPTHVAVVIMYRPKRNKLPIVVYKAKGELAHEVFRIARKFKIPIFREKWLARKLFEIADPGKFVPSSLLTHVADIIGKNLSLLPDLAKEFRDAVKAPQVNNI